MVTRLSAAAVLLFYAPLWADAQTAPAPNGSPPNLSPTGSPTDGDAGGAPTGPRTAARILDESRLRLRRLRSLSARLTQEAVVGGHKFTGEGRLLIASGGRVRIELDPPADQRAISPSLLQISNGSVLHTRYALGERIAVTRRDLRSVRAEAAARPSGAALAGDLASGGLAGSLASLRTAMRWEEPAVEIVADRSVVVLTGRWTPGARTVIAERENALKPDGVTVFLDADTLFPVRFRYWTQIERGPRVPLLTLDFADVTVGGQIAATEFNFTLPDGLEVEDQTEPAVVRARTAGLPKPVRPEPDGADKDGEPNAAPAAAPPAAPPAGGTE